VNKYHGTIFFPPAPIESRYWKACGGTERSTPPYFATVRMTLRPQSRNWWPLSKRFQCNHHLKTKWNKTSFCCCTWNLVLVCITFWTFSSIKRAIVRKVDQRCIIHCSGTNRDESARFSVLGAHPKTQLGRHCRSLRLEIDLLVWYYFNLILWCHYLKLWSWGSEHCDR